MSSISAQKRLRLMNRDSCQCQYCGKALCIDTYQLDHIQPQSFGGNSSDENLRLACSACNTSKGNRSLEDFRMICRVKNSIYSGIIGGNATKKLIEIGVLFPELPEHLFFFELQGEKK